MDEFYLNEVLMSTLAAVDRQIEELEKYAKTHISADADPVKLMDINGGWQMIPLLVAKAQLLSVLAKSKSDRKNIVFHGLKPTSPALAGRYDRMIRLTGLTYRTIRHLYELGFEFIEQDEPTNTVLYTIRKRVSDD